MGWLGEVIRNDGVGGSIPSRGTTTTLRSSKRFISLSYFSISVPLWDMLEKGGTIGGRFVLLELALRDVDLRAPTVE